MKFLALIGRFLYSWIFIPVGIHHFEAGRVAYAAKQGVPMPELLVPVSGIIASLGGILILLGFKSRVGAWLIVLFLVPVTLMMHNYWTLTDPMAAQMQQAMFNKNVSILGGALLIAYFGAGPLSVDAFMSHKKN